MSHSSLTLEALGSLSTFVCDEAANMLSRCTKDQIYEMFGNWPPAVRDPWRQRPWNLPRSSYRSWCAAMASRSSGADRASWWHVRLCFLMICSPSAAMKLTTGRFRSATSLGGTCTDSSLNGDTENLVTRHGSHRGPGGSLVQWDTKCATAHSNASGFFGVCRQATLTQRVRQLFTYFPT